MKKITKQYVTCLILTFCLIPILAYSAATLEKQRLTLAVGGKSSLYYLPLTIAEQLGYFKEVGLEVNIVDFAGGSKSLQALIGGSVDVVNGAYEHTIKLQAKKQIITAFVLTGQTPQIVLAASRKTLPHYQKMSDLKGKKIGITAPGSSTHMFAVFLLKQTGLSPDSVSFIHLNTPLHAIGAIQRGEIDALVYTEPVISLLEKDNAIQIIVDTRTPEGSRAVFGETMLAGALYTKPSFLNNHPETVKALTRAMLKALHWLKNASPEQVAAVVPRSYLLNNPSLYKLAYSHISHSFSETGLFSQDAAKNVLRVLTIFDTNIRPNTIDLNRTYTNEIVYQVMKGKSTQTNKYGD